MERAREFVEISDGEGGCEIWVRVVPGAPVSGVAGRMGGMVKVKVAAAPHDGKANRELVRFLAKLFGVKKGSVRIASGETSRNKRVRIEGAGRSEIEAALRKFL